MKSTLIAALAVAIIALASAPVQAGPLRRLAYRATHPIAPLGSYSGPRLGDGRGIQPFGGFFRRGGNASGGACAGGSCSR